MNGIKKIRFGVFCVLILIGSLSAQDLAEKGFSQALEFYQKRNYEQSKKRWEDFLSLFPNHLKSTAGKLMLLKCEYKLENYDQVISGGNLFLSQYPLSTYQDDVYQLLGNTYYRQENYREAVRQWLWVVDHTTVRDLRNKSASYALRTIEYRLPFEDLTKLRDELDPGSDAFAIVLLKHSQKLAEQNQFQPAIDELESFIRYNLRSKYISQASDLLNRLRGQAIGSYNWTVGVAVPLTGADASIGVAILEGIQYATNEFNQSQKSAGVEKQKVTVISRDTQSQPIQAVKAVADLATNTDVLAILGPLNSSDVIAAAGIVDCQQVPLISPTASENGLADLSPYVFQASPDFESRARALAEYAVTDLKLKSFAVLAPADNYGTGMSGSFTKTVTELGGTVVAQEWYFENAQNFKQQFERIRRVGLKKMFSDSVLQSNPQATREEIDTWYTERQKSSLEEYLNLRLKNPKLKIDSTDVQVTSIDAFFIPLYPEDIKFLAPQFVFYNFQSQLLGGEHWNDPPELKTQIRYVNGLVFLSDQYLEENSPDYLRFKTGFKTAKGMEADLYSLFGFDTMKGFLSQFNRIKIVNRENLRTALDSEISIPGIHNQIVFGKKGRVNSSVKILKYVDGKIVKLK